VARTWQQYEVCTFGVGWGPRSAQAGVPDVRAVTAQLVPLPDLNSPHSVRLDRLGGSLQWQQLVWAAGALRALRLPRAMGQC